MSTRFRIMTYNIHKAIGGLDRKYNLERVIESIRQSNPDIALLQEVDDNVPRSSMHRQVDRLGEALGYQHSAFQVNVSVKQGGYGNAILSRFPIENTWDLDLTIPLKKRRRALIAQVELGCQSLYVCNTHLGLAGMERKIQVRKLIAHEAVTHLDAKIPVVIGGDLNDVWSSLAKKLMHPSEFENASQYTKTFPAWYPLRALDGIYFRGNLQLEQCKVHRSDVAKRASDHLPLLAEFQTVVPDQES